MKLVKKHLTSCLRSTDEVLKNLLVPILGDAEMAIHALGDGKVSERRRLVMEAGNT